MTTQQTQNPHLQRIHGELRALIADVRGSFAGLSPEQFNWKPEPKKWSIAECMQHLLMAYSRYRPQLAKKIKDIPLPAQTFPAYRSTYMGRIFMGFVNPDKFRKTPAPPMFKPTKGSSYPLSFQKEYLNYLEELCAYIQKADHYNLNQVKINSSLGWIIRFNLGDYFEIESMHNRRHVGQMKRVMQKEHFPKST